MGTKPEEVTEMTFWKASDISKHLGCGRNKGYEILKTVNALVKARKIPTFEHRVRALFVTNYFLKGSIL